MPNNNDNKLGCGSPHNPVKCLKKSIRFLGVNSAGIRAKLTSFKNVINELSPAVFFLGETKLKDTGKLKIDNYDAFELVNLADRSLFKVR